MGCYEKLGPEAAAELEAAWATLSAQATEVTMLHAVATLSTAVSEAPGTYYAIGVAVNVLGRIEDRSGDLGEMALWTGPSPERFDIMAAGLRPGEDGDVPQRDVDRFALDMAEAMREASQRIDGLMADALEGIGKAKRALEKAERHARSAISASGK